MSNSVNTYQLSSFTGVRNSWPSARLLRDGEDPSKIISHNLEAHVRSGDYFITLATTLDSLSAELADYAPRARIEDIVSDLIYLYDNYAITKKED